MIREGKVEVVVECSMKEGKGGAPIKLFYIRKEISWVTLAVRWAHILTQTCVHSTVLWVGKGHRAHSLSQLLRAAHRKQGQMSKFAEHALNHSTTTDPTVRGTFDKSRMSSKS